MTAINACSLLAKQTLFDLVGERASSVIINFEQSIKPFLVWNIYFTFFWLLVDCSFYKGAIKSNCILLLCHVRFRSSRPELFCKKGVLRNFATFTRKRLCQSLFLNKVAGMRPATLLKERLWHRCFPVNFTKFLKTLFLQNTCGGCFWHFTVNPHSVVLELLARNRSNIWSLS